ncbi:M48 family metallopeptidase [Pseudoalteromonas maricaloris]|uniref:M48 family metallopeptidase n=1 Tax=Pseudoalteromonas maricaloris TaxID=184924 RepID=UPI00057DAC17|nr:YgjP-like metallopeptidase domain-containing protein [Pseudoalteromonas flavipulchra]KID37977.1 hypothetical protein QT15_04210 [Pseudoalteromonas flavipulchra NCIMB 2033 = ATCC BAA-314]MBD0782856.1 M48 family metallopeptidase [Pseudoalteromonas flavipulchra]MBE0372452.1 hypothetical protein [Pseudoalteromonas flavipulchra NCIMB 2033 = ATCC BAA-314]
MQYQLKKSRKRKSVAIKIKAGQVFVYAPEQICERWLHNWVESKSDWIKSKLALKVIPESPRPLETGIVQVFGETFTIQRGESTTSVIDFDNKRVLLKAVKNEWRELVMLLSETLNDYVDMVIARYQPDIQARFDTLKIRVYKSRWGSFSSKGVLAFNTLLIGAPKWVIDYVVVHELCHFHVMAHNSAFWRLVTKHYGHDHKMARRYLRDHGRDLMIEH